MNKQELKNTKATKYIKVAALKRIISSEDNNIKTSVSESDRTS